MRTVKVAVGKRRLADAWSEATGDRDAADARCVGPLETIVEVGDEPGKPVFSMRGLSRFGHGQRRCRTTSTFVARPYENSWGVSVPSCHRSCFVNGDLIASCRRTSGAAGLPIVVGTGPR